MVCPRLAERTITSSPVPESVGAAAAAGLLAPETSEGVSAPQVIAADAMATMRRPFLREGRILFMAALSTRTSLYANRPLALQRSFWSPPTAGRPAGRI